MGLPGIQQANYGRREKKQSAPAITDDFVVLKQNESFIVENICWTEALSQRLTEAGLLPAHSQAVQNPVQKLRDAIDTVCRGHLQTALQTFIEALEETHNVGISVRLRSLMQLDDDGDVDDMTTDTSCDTENVVTVEEKLLITRRKMKQWQMRALNLEQEKEGLEVTNNTMRELVEKTTKTGDEATVKIENLQTQQEILKHELLKRERGVGQWKKKEQEYQSHILQLREQISSLKCVSSGSSEPAPENRATEKVNDTKVTSLKRDKNTESLGSLVAGNVLGRTKKNHDRSNTDPTALPKLRQQGLKTLPHNAKLPSLGTARRLPPEGSSGEDNISTKRPPARPKNIINLGNLPLTNTKLPPLIKSQKLPLSSPRSTGKSLLSEIAAIATTTEKTPETISSTPLKAVMGEKWIDRQGGQIDIGNVALHIPPNSVSAPVLITITQTDHAKARQEQIQRAGLGSYMKAGLQIRLQPHGQRFLRPIYMQMKGLKASPGKHLIFHKAVDGHNNHDWTEVTEDVKPTTRKDDVVISINSFCIIETMRMLLPAVAVGMAIGYNFKLLQTHALALLNEKKGPCEFHVFHRDHDPCLQVVCMAQSRSSDNNNMNEKIKGLSNLKYLGYQSSRFELCDGERLYFYLDKSPNIAASFIFNFEESTSKGQRFQIPFSNESPSSNTHPSVVLVKRRVAEQLDDVTLCEAQLYSKPRSKVSGLDEPDGASDYEEPWEEAMRSNRVELVRTIDVRDILAYLIQNQIISLDEQDDIKSHRTRRGRIEALIDKLSKKGPKGFTVFVQALSEDYEHLSKSLTGHKVIPTT